MPRSEVLSRAQLLLYELETQVYLKQLEYYEASPEWRWLEQVFDVLADCRMLVDPTVPADQRPTVTLDTIRNQFRVLRERQLEEVYR